MPQLQVKEPQDAIRSQCEFELRAEGGSVVGAHNSGNPKLQTNVTKRVELGVGGKRGGGKDQQEKKRGITGRLVLTHETKTMGCLKVC